MPGGLHRSGNWMLILSTVLMAAGALLVGFDFGRRVGYVLLLLGVALSGLAALRMLRAGWSQR